MILPGFPKMMVGGGGLGPTTPLGAFIEGGYYLGTITVSSQKYALIWAPVATEVLLQWKTVATATAGTSSDDDGVSNTNAMVADSASHPAAEYCAAAIINGETDWYMPAINEISIAYGNMAHMPPGQEFDNSNAGYFSSTSGATASAAKRLRFSDGAITEAGKTATVIRTRPIRRVAVSW